MTREEWLTAMDDVFSKFKEYIRNSGEFKFSSMVLLTNLIGLYTNQNIVDKCVAYRIFYRSQQKIGEEMYTSFKR